MKSRRRLPRNGVKSSANSWVRSARLGRQSQSCHATAAATLGVTCDVPVIGATRRPQSLKRARQTRSEMRLMLLAALRRNTSTVEYLRRLGVKYITRSRSTSK